MKGTEASINHTARRLSSSFIAQSCNFAFHASFFHPLFCEWTEIPSLPCHVLVALSAIPYTLFNEVSLVLSDMNAIFCPRHKGVEWLTLPTNDSRDVPFCDQRNKNKLFICNLLEAISDGENLRAAREQVFPIDEVVVDFPSQLVMWICLAESSPVRKTGVVSGAHEKWFSGGFCGVRLKTERLQALVCKYPLWLPFIRSNYMRLWILMFR